MSALEITEKPCSGCGKICPRSDFLAIGKHKPGALRGKCPQCRSAREKAYFRKNNEVIRAKMAVYQAAHKEEMKATRIRTRLADPAHAAAMHAKVYAKNPKKSMDRTYARRAADPEGYRAYMVQWRKENPGAVRSYGAKRRAALASSEGAHTAADIVALMKSQKGKCVACKAGIRKSYHVDHIIPLARGGGNGKDNIQLLCPPCNQAKYTKHPIDFMQSKGFLL